MADRTRTRLSVALLALIATVACSAVPASAVSIVTVPAAPSAGAGQGLVAPVAPLTREVDPSTASRDREADDADTSRDVLRDNGLKSPWCADVAGPAAAFFTAANCKTSGISSISGSGDDIQFDWHIDTSDGPLGTPDMAATFAAWVTNAMAIVWSVMIAITKAAFLAVEFSLSFNPLSGDAQGHTTVAGLPEQVRTISAMLAAFTAVAGALSIMWRGVGQQRVSEALSTAILGFGLATIALVILANPYGTVGAAITGAQRIGLYVIGAAVDGQPAAGQRSAQRGLGAMGDALVDQPLAILEFGDVDWGTSPDRLDPKLKEAALARAREEHNDDRLRRVQEARTNLRLFTAWAANSPARNSINQEGSLLRVLCGTDDEENCKGPNAARAEFRAESGLWQRVIALLLVLFPLAMSWAILLLVAYKVLGGMVMSVIYLLQLVFVAPLAVAGHAGVERMIRYGGSYLGSILSVCTYSCLLALVMSVWRLISHWTQYGWAVQWLLLGFALLMLLVHRNALWGARRQMDSTLGAAGHRGAWLVAGFAARGLSKRGRLARGRRSTPNPKARAAQRAQMVKRRAAARRSRGSHHVAAGSGSSGAPKATTLTAPGPEGTTVRRSHLSWRERPRPVAEYVPRLADDPPTDRQTGQAKRERKQQVTAMLSARRADRQDAAPDLDALVRRRDRVVGLRQDAWNEFQTGTTSRVRRTAGRRVVRLLENERALESSVESAWAQRAARSAPRSDGAVRRERRDAANWLDRQYALPRGAGVQSGFPRADGSPARDRRYRDYPALASLAGSTPQRYREATPDQQLRLRAKIDRALRSRADGHAIIRADRAVTEKGSTGSKGAGAPRPAPDRRAEKRPRVNTREAASRAATPPGAPSDER